MYLKTAIAVVCVFILHVPLGGGSAVDRTKQHSVEILVVLDQKAYQQWYKTVESSTIQARALSTHVSIKSYVHAVFAGMNVVLGSLRRYGIRLDVRVLDIVQADATVTPRVNKNNIVQGSTAIADFSLWLKSHGYTGFDHALLFTGFTVADGTNLKTEGIAYRGSMCWPTSLSVVECQPSQNAALTAVHELAHSLNATHDGDKNCCSRKSSYVMSAVRSGTSSSRWIFSRCSACSIKRFLAKVTRYNDCLSPNRTVARAVDSRYLGELYSPDQICRMSYGTSSFVCRSLYGSAEDYHNLCEAIWCSTGGSNCKTVVGTDGTVCGHKKRCLAGKCIPFQNGPTNISDTCPLGDTPAPVSGNHTCPDVLRASPLNCQTPYFRKACCASCEQLSTGDEACPYGDAVSWCSSYHCRPPSPYAEVCCATCSP